MGRVSILLMIVIFLAACTFNTANNVQPRVVSTSTGEVAFDNAQKTAKTQPAQNPEEGFPMPPVFELPEQVPDETAVQKPTSGETNKIISIENLKYFPAQLTVKAGTKVTWKNNDHHNEQKNVLHMVIEKKNAFRSPRLSTGDSFSVTFTKPGTYDFFDPMYVKSVVESEDEELTSGEDSLLEGYIIVE